MKCALKFRSTVRRTVFLLQWLTKLLNSCLFLTQNGLERMHACFPFTALKFVEPKYTVKSEIQIIITVKFVGSFCSFYSESAGSLCSFLLF
ncbi:hypothetical protein SORBI_3003G241050 [Sorghum bicolor]|uniref:Secreted protein n=1 Tax=Sorghum bicolor TaxID=4558 RepID=A0A1W0VYN8_SORBI|nr:hypothetical protein SORBI_3003G241050 [Sorghum bicolor]